MKYILEFDKNINLSDYLDKYEDVETYTDIYCIDYSGSMGESKSEKIRKERDKKIDIIINDGK